MLNGCEQILGKVNHAVYWRELIKAEGESLCLLWIHDSQKRDFHVMKLESVNFVLQEIGHSQTGYF